MRRGVELREYVRFREVNPLDVASVRRAHAEATAERRAAKRAAAINERK